MKKTTAALKQKLHIIISLLAFGNAVFAQLPPRITGVCPNSPFGLDIREDMNGRGQICQDLGVKWVRGLEHEHFGRWNGDPNSPRNLINALKNFGVMPIPTLFYPSGWKEPGKLGPPADMNGYITKCYNLVKATHDLVPYYEHWNEPWVDEWAWNGGTADEYRVMIKQLWDRIKKDFPHVNLIGGGSTAYNRDIMYAKGEDVGYADGSVCHAYAFPGPNIFANILLQMKLDTLYSKTKGRAGAWQTEFGTYTDMFSSDKQTWVARTIPSSYLLHMLAAFYAKRPLRAFWFNWKGHGMHDIYNNPAALDAYRTMTRVLEGTKIIYDIYPKSKAMWGIVFANDYSTDSRARAAVFVNGPFYGDIGNPWVPGGGGGAQGNLPSDEYTGTLSLSGTGLQAFDYRGNQISDLSNIRLTQVEPVYILGNMSPAQLRDILANAKFRLKTEVKITALSFSGPLLKNRTIDIKVENVVNEVRSGVLNITPPAGWTLSGNSIAISSLQPGEQRIISFPVSTFSENPNNKYNISYSLSLNGKQGNQTGAWTIQAAYAPKKTISVDGNLSDWSDVIATDMANGAYRFKVAWDAGNLYFAAEVTDDSHAPFPPFDPSFSWFRANRVDGAKGDGNMDGLSIAIDCLKDNPDDLLKGHSNYEKACAADVDYEFFATYCTGNVNELWRYQAPGTNHQGYYPTNAALNPPLMKMDAGTGGSEGRIQFSRSGNKTIYEGAIAWKAIPDLKKELDKLNSGEYYFPNLAWKVNGGNAGKKFWTIESGQVEEGGYGFIPTWISGQYQNGGRVISRWAFVNGDGRSSLPPVNPGGSGLTVFPSNPSVCKGSSAVLVANGSMNYSWAPAAGLNTTTGATVTASPQLTTTYTVTGRDAGGKTLSAAVTVSVITAPMSPAVSPGTCYSLVSSAASGNQWYLNGNPIPGATQQTYHPSQNGTYTVEVDLNGCKSPMSQPHAYIAQSFKETVCMTSNVNIDGKLDEPLWNGSFHEICKTTIGNVDGVSANFKTRWDNNFLYVGADINDSQMNNSSANIWENSSVELYLDMNNAKTIAYEDNDFQYIIPWNGTNLFEQKGRTSGVQFKTANKTGGYTAEMAVPWSTLGVTPGNNATYGFDAGINISHSPGVRTSAIVWSGDINNFNNTSKFGEIKLDAGCINTSLNKKENHKPELVIYPNPAGNSMKISFVLEASEFVNVKICDILGRDITTIVEEILPQGKHEFNFNCDKDGVYFLRFTSGKSQVIRKLVFN